MFASTSELSQKSETSHDTVVNARDLASAWKVRNYIVTWFSQSVFACVIEDAALSICTEIENSADGWVGKHEMLSYVPLWRVAVAFKNMPYFDKPRSVRLMFLFTTKLT